jgi:hypothetical protein
MGTVRRKCVNHRAIADDHEVGVADFRFGYAGITELRETTDDCMMALRRDGRDQPHRVVLAHESATIGGRGSFGGTGMGRGGSSMGGGLSGSGSGISGG